MNLVGPWCPVLYQYQFLFFQLSVNLYKKDRTVGHLEIQTQRPCTDKPQQTTVSECSTYWNPVGLSTLVYLKDEPSMDPIDG